MTCHATALASPRKTKKFALIARGAQYQTLLPAPAEPWIEDEGNCYLEDLQNMLENGRSTSDRPESFEDYNALIEGSDSPLLSSQSGPVQYPWWLPAILSLSKDLVWLPHLRQHCSTPEP